MRLAISDRHVTRGRALIGPRQPGLRPSVHVLGCVLLNGGDAAIMAGQEATVRAATPGARITFSDTHPDQVTRYVSLDGTVPFLAHLLPRRGGRLRGVLRSVATYHQDAVVHEWTQSGARRWAARAVAGRRLRDVLDAIGSADVVAYAGGTSLVEHYDLSDKLRDLEVAVRLGKRLVFFPMSAGPFADQDNRRRLRAVFDHADAIVLRDGRSLGYVQELGVDPAKCHVRPDIAFAIAVPTDRWVDVDQVTQAPRVAVSVREWAHFRGLTVEAGRERFVASVRGLVTRLVEQHGASVTFVSTCQGRPEYWTDDAAFAREIDDGLPEGVRARTIVDDAARSPQEMLNFLGRFDAMVSTRLHGAILGVNVGVPTAAIAYEFKSQEVWNQLGLGDYVVDIEDVTTESLGDLGARLLTERERVREQLLVSIPPMADDALSVGALLGGSFTAREPARP